MDLTLKEALDTIEMQKKEIEYLKLQLEELRNIVATQCLKSFGN